MKNFGDRLWAYLKCSVADLFEYIEGEETKTG